MKAVILEHYGPAEFLRLAEIDTPRPNPNQALIKLHYAGINFIDVYFRTGLYPIPQFPAILGKEGLGEVVELGSQVTDMAVGDVVAFPFSVHGAYCEYVTVDADRLLPVPANIDPQAALAAMLQGLTAHYLLFSTFDAQPGHTVLIHAAAGGVGLLMVQMATMKGCRVIATVSTAEKAKLARSMGADEVIIYEDYKFADRARQLTGGHGVDVVYDSVAKATFEESLASLKPRGLLALYGNSSGAVDPFDLNRLNQAGSLFVTRPTLGHYIQDRAELTDRAEYLFRLMRKGQLITRVGGVYDLQNAAQAHSDLENRRTTGKLLLRVAAP